MIDPDFAATQIVDNLRAMECDTALAREILKLCELKIKRGELHSAGSRAACAGAKAGHH